MLSYHAKMLFRRSVTMGMMASRVEDDMQQIDNHEDKLLRKKGYRRARREKDVEQMSCSRQAM
jgi:hypothetical protein